MDDQQTPMFQPPDKQLAANLAVDYEAIPFKCYPAWWDKAMPGGAYQLRRLRAVKDAWIGDVLKYPLGKKFQLPDGTTVTSKDIVREMGEMRAAGGVLFVPSDADPVTTKPLFEYQPPHDVADTGVIKQWIDDADWDIFDGLLVPREVVEAAASGSGYSGRSIPFVMFLTMGDWELFGYVRAFKQQVAGPLVVRNFGAKANDFEMQPVPLLETVVDKVAGEETGGPLGGSSGDGTSGFHQGSPGGRPPMRVMQPQAMQFSTAEETPGTRTKRRAAASGVSDVAGTAGEVQRRLAALLKKN